MPIKTYLQPGVLFLFLYLAVIVLLLGSIITLTTWISIRRNKMKAPKIKKVLGASLFQVILGVVVLILLRNFKAGPIIGIGAGLTATILTGILLVKLILQNGWEQTFKVWGIAAVLQIVLIPICLILSLIILTIMITTIIPPQFFPSF